MADPTRLDAIELSSRLRERSITSRALVEACLARVSRLDGRLWAFVRLNPRAILEAGQADLLLDSRRTGPLTGLPVAIKDNLATAGLGTACGSAMLRDFLPPRDATVVSRLRQAGAVVLGKTNMDEFGMGSSTENSAGGPTRNPWDLQRVPGGSSGGSAVAVASRMTPLALGSDTGGSVRQPAAMCGVVGVKPTYGRVSRSGLVAFGSSLDQVGPLATSVRGAAMLLETIAGADAADMTSSRRAVGGYVAACDDGVQGLRIGLPREYFGEGLDPEIAAALASAAEALVRCGASVEETSLPHSRFAIPTYYLVATAEASSNLARFDAVRFGRRRAGGAGPDGMYRSSRGRYLGREVKRRIMLGTFALSAGYHDRFYGKAQRVRRLLREEFVAAFAEGFDALLCPATPTPAFRLGENVRDPLAMYLSDVFTASASLAGVPALAVPIGASRAGLPIGGQIVAAHFDEETLFRVAAALEAVFGTRIPPLADHGGAAAAEGVAG